MADADRPLRVFISYARRDCTAFAEELLHGLEVAGFDPVLDRHDIAAGEDWESRLAGLIQGADTVLFIISPAAVASERCAWEVKYAETQSKRILPVMAIETPDAAVPAGLQRLNYINFAQGNSYSVKLGELAKALRVNLGWLREHTRLSELGERWSMRGHPPVLLLRGPELEGAQTWLKNWAAGAPLPTDLHRTYIAKSEEAEGAIVRQSRARQRRLLATMSVALVVFAGLAGLSGWFWWVAQSRAEEAEIARDDAVKSEARAQASLLASQESERKALASEGRALLSAEAEGAAKDEATQNLQIAREQTELANLSNQRATASEQGRRQLEIIRLEILQGIEDLAKQPTVDRLMLNLLLSAADKGISLSAARLMQQHEIVSRENYERRLKHPHQSSAGSTVVIGFGYDLGITSYEEFAKHWGPYLPPNAIQKLSPVLRWRGKMDERMLEEMQAIEIPYDIASVVFTEVSLGATLANTKKAFPNTEELHPDSLGALVSLVYNRGPGLEGANRLEMREIRNLMSTRQFDQIPAQIRSMKRLWAGQPGREGVLIRREDEAVLFETGLAKMKLPQ